MHKISHIITWLSIAIFSLINLSAAAQSHTHADGTTHGDHEEKSTDDSAPKTDHFTVYGQSDRYELTLYYPELEAGKEAHLRLYVADYQTNKPIEKATLSITAAQGTATLEVHPEAAGIYELHATFTENKNYTLNVQIAHPNGADLIGLPNIEVGKKLVAEASGHTHTHSHGWMWFLGGLLAGAVLMYITIKSRSRALTAIAFVISGWLSTPYVSPAYAHGDDDHGAGGGGGGFGKAVFAPKETQFLFEVQTMPTAIGNYQAAKTMYGTIVPASGGLGVVMAPQAGRITSVKVAVGQTVRAGQVVATMHQSVGTPDAVNVAATNSGLTLQIEQARVRLAAAQREYDRLKKIEDIAAGKDVAAAEASLNTARSELQTLENQSVGSNQTANDRTVALVAPISGVVGAYTLAAGAEVTAGQTLLTITNINKVYVEAQVYDRDLEAVQVGNTFSVACSTDDHKTAKVRLISQAQTMNPGNQSQRVLFELDNPDGEFKIGEFVTIKALHNQSNRLISVPNSALTEINGKTAVFIKHAPEIFELAYVKTGEDDGTHTIIMQGFEEGEKIVISGTYEVKMMFLNQ
jgi:membrane fusion protein, heavy metal efflux system